MTPKELQDRLQSLCHCAIHVLLHENTSTYASARREGKGVRLALHKLFLHSPTPVLEALVRFATKPDRACRAMIRQMAHFYFTKIAPPEEKTPKRLSPGSHVDLQGLYDAVNATYFAGAIKVPIQWFTPPAYRKFRHMTFGVYDRTQPLIRINRLLDHPDVPSPFIEFVVYHEMLHDVCLPYFDARGRLIVHTAEFRKKEAKHPHYEFSKKWEKKSLSFFKRNCHGRS